MSKIFIVGIGPGHSDYILPKAIKTIEKCGVIIGGKRNLDSINQIATLETKKSIVIEGNLVEVKDYISNNYTIQDIAVVVSGDTGFHSLLSYLKKNLAKEIRLEVVPGLSSIQYMYAKLKRPWQNAYVSSLHGRNIEVEEIVNKQKEVILLTDKYWNPNKIAQRLIDKNITDKWMYIGSNLSYENEKIFKFKIENVPNIDYGLNVVVISDE
ncbi:precorrin-6y C5,15-methyltransferase (decarboxylating) subunit CbiE [Proteinivorax tanatarense]|uniref:Precorrin-6y C5,15-methyltransferase (Decarboxylating) subunit CbiE n=1 Tax=Proteinivorax tanatarense TaxID=1260629 RepID=A0AAU7VK16_9FIRM